jgi:hypothetical protein
MGATMEIMTQALKLSVAKVLATNNISLPHLSIAGPNILKKCMNYEVLEVLYAHVYIVRVQDYKKVE